MADNKNEFYSKTPIRLILSTVDSVHTFMHYMVIIYERESDGTVSNIYIPLIGGSNSDTDIQKVRFVDDESVIVWKTTVETGFFSGQKQKTELFEVRINRKFQSGL